MVKFDESMIGKKVIVDKKSYMLRLINTLGTIIEFDKNNELMHYKVRFDNMGKGITLWMFDDEIELMEDYMGATNEEIWKMLKPKMEKNGLDIITLDTNIGIKTDMYDVDDVQKAIAIAYRSGFERAVKGRPFKFEDKTKKENSNEG